MQPDIVFNIESLHGKVFTFHQFELWHINTTLLRDLVILILYLSHILGIVGMAELY